jgi:hypothetical protein
MTPVVDSPSETPLIFLLTGKLFYFMLHRLPEYRLGMFEPNIHYCVFRAVLLVVRMVDSILESKPGKEPGGNARSYRRPL